MSKYICSKDTMCTSTVDKLFDYKKTLIELNSNFTIKFTLSDCCSLPCDSKVEILETKLHYNVCKVEKDVLVNGYSVGSKLPNLKYSFCFKDEYINLTEENYNKILLNITECIKLKISIILELKAIAHTKDCEDKYIEAFGECEDCIETVLMTSICIPNHKCILENLFVDLENSLIAVVNPHYVFLSPIFNCHSNIDGFWGKVFINYGLTLNVSSYMPINKLTCKWPTQCENGCVKKSV